MLPHEGAAPCWDTLSQRWGRKKEGGERSVSHENGNKRDEFYPFISGKKIAQCLLCSGDINI